MMSSLKIGVHPGLLVLGRDLVAPWEFVRDSIGHMPDDKSKTRPQDAERVNVHEDYI